MILTEKTKKRERNKIMTLVNVLKLCVSTGIIVLAPTNSQLFTCQKPVNDLIWHIILKYINYYHLG